MLGTQEVNVSVTGTVTLSTSLPALTGDIDLNGPSSGTFTVTGGSGVTIFAGAAAFQKNAAGNLTLSAANTYSGGTTVSAGTLQGSTTSLQGDIANNANVTFSQSSTGTYAGNMSGTGSLTKAGTGTPTKKQYNLRAAQSAASGNALAAKGWAGASRLLRNGEVLFNDNAVVQSFLDAERSFTLSAALLVSFDERFAGLLVGFKLEAGMSDEALVAQARKRLAEGRLDMTVANRLEDVTAGATRWHVLTARGEAALVEGSKAQAARALALAVSDRIGRA